MEDVAVSEEPSTSNYRFDIDEDTARYLQKYPNLNKNSKENTQLDMGRQLLQASKLGDVEEIKRLVAAGAPFTADWLGTSPLHWTAHYNYVDISELLLRSGISHDARNKVDRTPLHVASQMGHLEIVKLLLAFGADPNARDMLRMSPLHWAADGGNKEVARVLLDHGSFTSSSSKFGKTPSDCAEDNGHFDIIKMIEEMKALPPEERTARVNRTRRESAALGQKLRLNENIGPETNGEILNMVSKRKRMGIVVKQNENGNNLVEVVERFDDESLKAKSSNSLIKSSADKTLELLKDHGITMLEPDNGTVVSSVVENGQSVKLTEAGKLALSSSKPISSLQPKATIEIPKVSGPVQQTIKLPNGKKIIQIKADELINMTKEKKVIIKQTRSVPNTRFYEGKYFTKEELEVRLKNKMTETEKQITQLKRMLEQKENELTNIKKHYDSLIKPNNDSK